MMNRYLDTLLDWFASLAVVLTQSVLVGLLMGVLFLFAYPDTPLVVQCVKWLRGL